MTLALNLFPFLSLSFTLMLRELCLSRLGFSKASRRVSTTCSRYATSRNLSLSWMDLGEMPEIFGDPLLYLEGKLSKANILGYTKASWAAAEYFLRGIGLKDQ